MLIPKKPMEIQRGYPERARAMMKQCGRIICYPLCWLCSHVLLGADTATFRTNVPYRRYVIGLLVICDGCFVLIADILKYYLMESTAMRTLRTPMLHCTLAVSAYDGAFAL